MYIPFVCEVCRALVIASQIIFCVLAAAKVASSEEKCYALLKKTFKAVFMCKDETAMKIVSLIQTLEVIGLISWVVYFCQPRG